MQTHKDMILSDITGPMSKRRVARKVPSLSLAFFSLSHSSFMMLCSRLLLLSARYWPIVIFTWCST